MKTIVICSSAAFYKHVNEIADQLSAKGLRVIVPETAVKMKKRGNYDVAAVKTRYVNKVDFNKKARLMKNHFDEVAEADAILIVNDKKNGIAGYIGPNGLMEMAVAFYLNKPIYVLNKVGNDMPVYEEVVGVGAIIIDGNLDKIDTDIAF